MAKALEAGALLLILLLSPARGRADDTAANDLYVRDLAGVRPVVRWLEAEANRIGAVQVLVAFEVTSFSPPPDAPEITRHEDLALELPTWLDGLALWALAGTHPIRVTSSLNPVSIAVGDEGWRERAEAIVRHRWWEDRRIPRLESAARWMKRLLQRTDCVLGGTTARSPRMLVYVAGRRPPERFGSARRAEAPDWHRKLLDRGDAFDPEAVARVLEPKGARLYVVSPEAFFGEHLPYRELPVLPWASRPRLLPHDLAPDDEVHGIVEGGGLLQPAPGLDAETRRLLRILGERGPTGAPVVVRGGRAGPRGSLLLPPHESRLRFLGAPPLYFDTVGSRLISCDHTPSGYGAWVYARAAAESEGRYVLFPRCGRPLRDALPRDDALLARLAPALIHRPSFLEQRSGDPALEVLCRVAARLARVTPSGDGMSPTARPVWSDYERARPLRLAKGAPRGRCPVAPSYWPGFRHVVDMARHVRGTVLPVYDEAAREIRAAIAAVDAGEDDRSHPRSVAHLRRFRFDLALSAFHLEAFAVGVLALGESQAAWDRLRSRGMCLQPAIRLSDCLDAYDGRTIAALDEAAYAGWTPREARGYQGNLLGPAADDPAFRAKRERARVFLRLDPRLRPRAERLIRAAEHVMAYLARTPWGWGVYYTDAYTFSFPPP